MSDDTLSPAFEAAVSEWDDHIAHCDVCLTLGRELCDEGEFLAEEVTIVRDRETPRVEAPRRRFELPFARSPALPGVPA